MNNHMLMHGHGGRRGVSSLFCPRASINAPAKTTQGASITTGYFTYEKVSLNNFFVSMNVDTDNQFHQYHRLHLTDSIFSIGFIIYL
jgi:hypothetical protein